MLTNQTQGPVEINTFPQASEELDQLRSQFDQEVLIPFSVYGNIPKPEETTKIVLAYVNNLADLRVKNPFEYVVYLTFYHRPHLGEYWAIFNALEDSKARGIVLLLISMIAGNDKGAGRALLDENYLTWQAYLSLRLQQKADTQPITIETDRLVSTTTDETGQVTGESVIPTKLKFTDREIPFIIARLSADANAVKIYARACLEVINHQNKIANCIVLLNYLNAVERIDYSTGIRRALFETLLEKDARRILTEEFFSQNQELQKCWEMAELEFINSRAET